MHLSEVRPEETRRSRNRAFRVPVWRSGGSKLWGAEKRREGLATMIDVTTSAEFYTEEEGDFLAASGYSFVLVTCLVD